eukprot:Awhi_evm1s12924
MKPLYERIRNHFQYHGLPYMHSMVLPTNRDIREVLKILQPRVIAIEDESFLEAVKILPEDTSRNLEANINVVDRLCRKYMKYAKIKNNTMDYLEVNGTNIKELEMTELQLEPMANHIDTNHYFIYLVIVKCKGTEFKALFPNTHRFRNLAVYEMF